jgi:hypothetical protein
VESRFHVGDTLSRRPLASEQVITLFQQLLQRRRDVREWLSAGVPHVPAASVAALRSGNDGPGAPGRPEHSEHLQRRGDRAVLSDLVVADTYFALQHHDGVKEADALGALHRLFEDGEIEPTGGAGEVLATRSLASAKPGFVNRLIHRAYVTGGGRMATLETRAARLSAVVVLGR